MMKLPLKTTLVIILTIGLISATPFGKKKTKQIGKFVPINTEMASETWSDQLPKAYYIFETEVTNWDYQEFLWHVKKNDPEKYAIAKIDTAAWQNLEGFYADHYHIHQTFKEHPVVNISKEAAALYCDWLEVALAQTYLKDVDFEYEIRLPTKAEWQYAASSGVETNVYAWGGPYIRNGRGELLCAFNNLGAENIHTNPETGELEVKGPGVLNMPFPAQPAKSKSFAKNNFGLYDVCGNAAEMLLDEDVVVGGHWNAPGGDVQVKSEMPHDGAPSRYVGFRPVLVVK